MIDLHLRADSADALASECPFMQGVDQAGLPFWRSNGDGWALDIIGPVVTVAGVYDDEGKQLAAPEWDNRFHANLRCDETIAALIPEHLIVVPELPMRGWA